MKKVQLVGDLNNAGGSIISTNQVLFYVDGVLIATTGSPVATHPEAHVGAITSGSPGRNLFINGVLVVADQDPDTCGHLRATSLINKVLFVDV